MNKNISYVLDLCVSSLAHTQCYLIAAIFKLLCHNIGSTMQSIQRNIKTNLGLEFCPSLLHK